MASTKLFIAGLLVVIVVGAGFAAFEPFSEEEPETNPPIYNRVVFEGQVTGNSEFSINGTLYQSTHGANRERFENVSFRLYDDDGSLLRGDCLGTISTSRSFDISLQHPTLPKYVVFASPEFYTADTVNDFGVYSFVENDGEYLPRVWSIPDDLPVDITAHDPCA